MSRYNLSGKPVLETLLTQKHMNFCYEKEYTYIVF